MASSETARAAPPRDADGDPQIEQLPGRLDPQNIPAKRDLQDLRIAWLARRFHLSLAMAEAIAESAFSVGGAH
jgi:hypothetical protein